MITLLAILVITIGCILNTWIDKLLGFSDLLGLNVLFEDNQQCIVAHTGLFQVLKD